jgi:predicted PurR-regulated permease PerM
VAVLVRRVRTLKTRGLAGAILALAAAIALLYYGRALLITLATAVILAFILEPFVGLLMRMRIPRPLASFVVCSVALMLLYLTALGIYTQAAGLREDLPKYGERVNEIAEQVLGKVEAMERSAYQLLVPKRFRPSEQATQPPPAEPQVARRRRSAEPPAPVPAAPPQVQEVRIRPQRPPLVDFLYSHLGSLYDALLMASFVPFLVYFMLSWRDHMHRTFLQLFGDQARGVASQTLDGIATMARAFVVGNFVLGLLLAIVSTLVFWLFRLPYPLLIGPVSGFLSLVPYLGLPLALIPPFMAALTVYNTLATYVIIGTIVAVLHLLAMNLLYPKIVGPRVHLNPLVVTIALMFWAALWGAAGLVLAIPLTAGVKAVCDNVDKLQPYGKLLGD